jgi:hypothetical protein
MTPTDYREQWACLRAIVRSVEPAQLALPPALAAAVNPTSFGYRGDPNDDDWFGSRMGKFDPLALAETAAGLSFDYLFEVERATRLHTLNPSPTVSATTFPSLHAVLTTVMAAVIPPAGGACYGETSAYGDQTAALLPLLTANVFADKLLTMLERATFRIRRVVLWAVAEVREVHVQLCVYTAVHRTARTARTARAVRFSETN